MASITKNYVVINKLQGRTDSQTTIGSASSVYYSSKEAKRIYATDSNNKLSIVWDVHEALLSSNNIEVEAAKIDNLKSILSVISKSTDVEGVSQDLDYTVSPNSLSANTTSNSKTNTIAITQETTGNSININVVQASNNLLKTYYDTPILKNINVEEVGPEGGTISIEVTYTQNKYLEYTNGTTNKTSINGTATAKIEELSSSLGTTIVNGQAKVLSANDSVYTSSRTVATITKISFSANGVSSGTLTTNTNILQTPNNVYHSYGTPTITLKSTDVGANGTSSVLTVEYSQLRTSTYDSGYINSTTQNKTTLTGTVSKTATSGNYITKITKSILVTGTSVNTILGNTNIGSVTSTSLDYTNKSRTNVATIGITVSINGVLGSASLNIYQAANTVTITYSNLQYKSITLKSGTTEVTAISVYGTAVTPYVNYSQVKKTVSTAIPSGKTETISGQVKPNDIIGTSYNGGVLNDDVTISANHLHTTETIKRNVYVISDVSFSANGQSVAPSITYNVQQEANTYTLTEGEYSVEVSTNSTSIVNTGGTFNVTASCKRAYTKTFKTTEKVSGYTGKSANIKGTNCTVSTTSITNYGTIVATVAENPYKTSRDIKVEVTSVDDTSKTTSVVVSQDASVYSLSAVLPLVSYTEQTITVQVTSTLNNKAYKPDTVTVSGITNAKVESVVLATDISNSTIYYVKISVPQNDTAYSRTLNLSVKQTYGESKVFTITQNPKPKPSKKAVFTGSFSFITQLGTVNYNRVTALNPAFSAVNSTTSEYNYTGGTLNNVSFVVSETRDGSSTPIYTKTYDSITVAKDSTTAVSSLLLSNPGGNTNVYVLIYWDDELQDVFPIMGPTGEHNLQ